MIEPTWMLKDANEKPLPDSAKGLPRIVQHLLSTRGEWTEESLASFLDPRLKTLSDPFLMGEMQEAVARIFSAIDQGQTITLFGDYDVDGITSLTLMTKVVEAYGVTPNLMIPQRSKEGYGLSEKSVARCLSSYPETELVIAMDCGTSSVAEIEILRQQGIDVIVLDHHESNTGVRPNCNAIVNPKANFTPTAEGDFSYLCAAGVVFKVCHALLKTRFLESVKLKDLLDLVAIATVADIVPLLEENRVLVRHGLKALGDTTKAGLITLKEVAGVSDRPEASDIGYKIGPRINAAGRMDAPLESLEALMTQSAERAQYLVQRLNNYNQDRQSYEKEIFNQALAQVEEMQLDQQHCIIVAQEGWHPGVVGIVAARLMRRFFKPVFVVAIDENGDGKGSGRSINELSLVEAIEAGREYLTAGGGHHAAAGMALRQENIPAFRDAVNNYFEQETTAEERAPRFLIDADVDLEELTFEFMESYEKLKPFGMKNPQPIFMTRNVQNSRPPRELKNNHLKLTLAQSGVERDAIFFGGGALDLPPQPWDISYTVDKNEFRGRVTLQLTIQHVRAAQ